MFRYVIVALMLSTGSAYASCETPELELSLDQDVGGYSDSQSISLSFVIPLGKKVQRACDAELAVERADARKKQAEERDRIADAIDQELDNLQQRIAICSDFEMDTAPNSIKTFCGDLLQ